jgi:hypothetical protein
MLLENPGIEAENYIRFKRVSIRLLWSNDRYPKLIQSLLGRNLKAGTNIVF